MKIRRDLILFTLLGLASVVPSRAQLDEWELDTDQISEAGQAIFDFVAPPEVREEYRFYTADELDSLFTPMEQALRGEDLTALADLAPQAHQTLGRLRANPENQALADWMEARVDYFEMAAEQQQRETARRQPRSQTPPAQTAKLPPHPKTPSPAPRPPHPETTPESTATPPTAAPTAAEPAPDTGAVAYAENKQAWIAKLSGRPAPARAAALLPRLKKIFRSEGVPEELVWQAEAESTFNPQARSPVGAAGLYQFMPATARSFGLSLSPTDERLNADKSARAAAQYLKKLHGRFHSWPLALAAYNCGEGRVSKTLRSTGGSTFLDIHQRLPAETRMYVPKIAALIQLREQADLEQL